MSNTGCPNCGAEMDHDECPECEHYDDPDECECAYCWDYRNTLEDQS